MITLLVPTCGGNIANFIRTKDSAKSVCDETVAISTCLFQDDLDELKTVADKVVELPWNHVYHHGFGDMHNKGHKIAKNDWMILLGVAETIHSGHEKIQREIQDRDGFCVYTCWHTNDPNRWRRCYNRNHAYWSGGIHESILGGRTAGLLFEMRDTEKTPCDDPLKAEALKFHKGCLYNMRYKYLLEHPESLGGTDPGWNAFVRGAKESILGYCKDHEDLIAPAMAGDLQGFLDSVRYRMEHGQPAKGVNYAPQGQPMSEGA